MDEKSLSQNESLELIARMIRNTNDRLEAGAGRPFLIWGYTSLIVTLAVWVALALTHNYWWNFLWFVIPVVGWPLMMITQKKYESGCTTYIDRIVGYVWIVFGLLCMCQTVATFIPMHASPVLFVMLLLLGAGTALTGLIIKFRCCVVTGFMGMAMFFIQFLNLSGQWQMLCFAVGVVLLLIIPGHVLNLKARRKCCRS